MNNNSFSEDLGIFLSQIHREIEERNNQGNEKMIENAINEEKNKAMSLVNAALQQGNFQTFYRVDRNLNEKIFPRLIDQLRELFPCFDEVNGNDTERIFSITVSHSLGESIDKLKQEIEETYEKKINNMREKHNLEIMSLQKEIDRKKEYPIGTIFPKLSTLSNEMETYRDLKTEVQKEKRVSDGRK